VAARPRPGSPGRGPTSGDTEAARRTLGEAEKLVERLLKLDPNGPDSLHEAVCRGTQRRPQLPLQG
jgi:hypothetical protein